MLTGRILAGLGALVVAALLVAAIDRNGYVRGYNTCEVKWQQAQLEVADALAHLARQYAQADATLAGVRAEKDRLVSDIDRRVKDALANLPDRECGWSDDERVWLNTSYCELFPTAPACKVP